MLCESWVSFYTHTIRAERTMSQDFLLNKKELLLLEIQSHLIVPRGTLTFFRMFHSGLAW